MTIRLTSSRWVAQARHVLRQPWRDLALLAQAFLILGIARLAILRLGYRRLEGFMGERMTESSRELSDGQQQQARRVDIALRRASKRTPWVSNCFPQALAGAFLLRRREIEPTIYLGAKLDRTTDAGMLAHAWLRAGERYVSGGDGAKKYGTLIAYARPTATE